MSLIQPVSDVNNTFLSRREITCNFAGLAGKLKKLEAIDMITKEFDLGNKVVIPMRLKSHSGKSIVTGTFFVYDDEGLAKKHIDPTIFTRLEKSKAKKAEAEKAEAPAEAESPAETETPAEETESKADVAEPEESKEEKSE
jgi:ribosomal protein S24E